MLNLNLTIDEYNRRIEDIINTMPKPNNIMDIPKKYCKYADTDSEYGEIDFTENIFNLDKVTIPICKYFTTLDTWTETTNIKCWNCNLYFKTRPVFIPVTVEEISIGLFRYKTCGNFCCFSCAKSYLFKNYDIPDRDIIYDNLLKLYEIFNGKKIMSIIDAPDKSLMKVFGGTLTEIEYRDLLEKKFD